jgi:hypothetical protein
MGDFGESGPVFFCLTHRRTNGRVVDSLQSGKVVQWTIFENKKLLATSPETQDLLPKGPKETQRKSSETHAKVGRLGMTSVKPFRILVGAQGEGVYRRNRPTSSSSRGDREKQNLTAEAQRPGHLRPSADRTVKTRKQGRNWAGLDRWKTRKSGFDRSVTARSNWDWTFVFNKAL